MPDLSRFGGKPRHLFVFMRQGLTLRFFSGTRGRTIEVGGHTYLGEQIERDAIKQTVERAKDKLKIKMPHLLDPGAPEYPATQVLGGWWRPYIPADPIRVMCLDHQAGSDDPPRVVWMGWAVQPAYSDTELELTCDPNPPAGAMGNQGAKWQRACWKTPYSTGLRGCNLDPEDYEFDAELTDVDGLTLSATEFASAPFPLTGGAVTWSRQVGELEIEEERPIMSHVGDTITILYGGAGLAEDLEVKVIPTCPGTWAACLARGNTINYGGAIYKPVGNPDAESMSWG